MFQHVSACVTCFASPADCCLSLLLFALQALVWYKDNTSTAAADLAAAPEQQQLGTHTSGSPPVVSDLIAFYEQTILEAGSEAGSSSSRRSSTDSSEKVGQQWGSRRGSNDSDESFSFWP
jgi:hypothetical protein